jgi:hypothetical protein
VRDKRRPGNQFADPHIGVRPLLEWHVKRREYSSTARGFTALRGGTAHTMSVGS